MYSNKEYTVRVEYVLESRTRLGAPQTPGFIYNVFAESDKGNDKLASVKNKSLYDALDEGSAVLLMRLAVSNETSIVRVRVQGLPFTEGGKKMLTDKYAAETQFLNFHFE